MHPLSRTGGISVLAAVVALASASVGHADGTVQNQISVYTGANAEGYLQPLVNAFGATLNSSFGYSAYIPPTSFHVSLEVPVMGVFFSDDDKTFDASTEGSFDPPTSAKASTVVGSGTAKTVTGTGGAQFTFPGGLSLNSFGLAVPQLRVSSFSGTEAVLRWVGYETGDSDVGKISLFGIGGRHSISQYLGASPVLDVSAGLMWQTFKVGENSAGGDFVSTNAFAMQVQASRRAPVGFMTLEPYAALAYENLSVDVDYDDGNGNMESLSMDAENSMRFTLGAGLNFTAGQLWADYSFANTSNFSFGLALGNVGR